MPDLSCPISSVEGLSHTVKALQANLFFLQWLGKSTSCLFQAATNMCSHQDLIGVVSQGLWLKGHHHLSVHARRNHARLPRAEEGWGGHGEESCCRWQYPAEEAWHAWLGVQSAQGESWSFLQRGRACA